ncbi:radical SAM protein [Helicobacter pullorum]|uniref:radical SAM protein n=1 Tax=Helicobacter pullorum TaxID=35818 RepID=UPI0013158094|nr:radical SAM protein [Helicobacter pullorum]
MFFFLFFYDLWNYSVVVGEGIIAFNIGVRECSIEDVEMIIYADNNSYIPFFNPNEKNVDSIFFKLVSIGNFFQYATEYAYRNNLIVKEQRNFLHAQYFNKNKDFFFEDRRLFNLSKQWNRIGNFSKIVMPSYPRVIYIELLNYCNMHCVSCPWFRNEIRGKWVKDYFEVDRVLAGSKVENVIKYSAQAKSKLIFSGPGEPLLDDRLENFVKYAKKVGVECVEIATNGILLDIDRFFNLLDNGVDSFQIGISFDKESYDECELFEQVKNNIFSIVGKNILIENKNIKINIYCNVHSKDKIPEALEFFNKIKNVASKVKCHFSYSDILEVNISSNCKNGQNQHRNRYVCGAPFSSLYVYSDGHIACCLQQRQFAGSIDIGSVSYGNIYEKSLEEIWGGVAHKEFCQSHLKKHFEGSKFIPCCSNSECWRNDI